MHPVWEVTNVFFVFFFVGFVGFFPESIKYLGTVLLIPSPVNFECNAKKPAPKSIEAIMI
jgi:hypothetical protein